MATLPSKSGAVTLADFAKSIDPDGRVSAVIELLNQNNTALRDILWLEGNLPTGHRTTVRTGLPEATWRKLYQGVQPSKSTRAQVEDSVGILEARSEVDKDIADLNGNTAAFRLSEAKAHIEGMSQQMLEQIFYGDATLHPERFTGLTPRYSTLSSSVPISQNVVSAGGSNNENTSIWLVCWGEDTISGIYPKGSQAGLQHQDLGLDDAFDNNGNRYRAYIDWFQWKAGISVRDWRYAVRICNIDVDHLIAGSNTQAPTASTNILKLMIDAFARIPNIGTGRPVFYAHRVVTASLAKMALDKSQSVLAIQPATTQLGDVTPGFAGAGTLEFLGVPIRTVDALLRNESNVS